MVATPLVLAPPFPAGAFGPAPELVLGEEKTKALLDRLSTFQDDRRKVAAYNRYRIFTEDFRGLIEGAIGAKWNDPDTRKEMAKFISVSLNLGLDITKQVAVVYKQGATRIVQDGEGDASSQNEALHKAAIESWIDTEAPIWNQLAFLLGPICVLPVVRRRKLRWETLLPHYYDIIRDPEDPLGSPLAVGFTIASDDELSQEADTILVDGRFWYYYKNKGGDPKLVKQIPHGAGTFPGAILRFDIPYGQDWWGGPRNQRLYDGTIDIGVVNSALNFVRKSQSHKLLSIIGDLSGMGRGQKLEPEGPVAAHVTREDGGTNAIDIDTIDFDTAPDNFIRHIRFIAESVIESFGIPAYTVNFDTSHGSEGERVRLAHEGLTELRNQQVPFCRRFEHELWSKAVRVMRAANHPLSKQLPTKEEMDDGFRVEFPQLARSFNDPNAETAFLDWSLSKGLTSQRRLLARLYPTASEDQIKKLHEEIMKEQIEFNDVATKRDLSLGGNQEIQTAAEAMGSMGPAMRAMNKAQKPVEEKESDE